MAGGKNDLPRDVKTIKALLTSMGVDENEPRVVRQFLELFYRNGVDLLMDAKAYSNHAGKSRIDSADVNLAVRSKNYFSFTGSPPPEVVDAAKKLNSVAIPSLPSVGPSLPPVRDTLIAPNYQREIQKNHPSEAVEVQEEEKDESDIDMNPPKRVCLSKPPQQQKPSLLTETRNQVTFPLGMKRLR